MAGKQAVKTKLDSLGLPFTSGIKFGQLLFVSGQGPLDATGKLVGGDIAVQTRTTLENFRNVLEAAGSTMDNVLQTTVFLKDLKEFREMNNAYSQFFNDPKPARATVQVADLLFGMRVEIQGIAFVPLKKRPKGYFRSSRTLPRNLVGNDRFSWQLRSRFSRYFQLGFNSNTV